MPCGASILMLRVIAPDAGPSFGNFDPRKFTNNNLTKAENIGFNVSSKVTSQFRLQAMIQDFSNVNCPEPYFSGELCYPASLPASCDCNFEDYCQKKTVVEIVVPIATAIIGILGGIGGVLLKQYLDNRYGKSEQHSTD